MRVLLTGGAGYIGSHTAVVLLEQNHHVVIVDDLSNGNIEAVKRVERITGKPISFVKNDLTNRIETFQNLDGHKFDAVIHFAGLKAVGESVANPLRYYRTNLDSTLVLLELMHNRDVNKIVFSSSATVYGYPQSETIAETHPVGIGITNPYGWTKSMNEQILHDAATAWPGLSVVNLRYFNPVGAHPSGLIGEDPSDIPNNLMPFIAQVAGGRRPRLSVFGNDYDTPDGSGVRDYIHVMDLAEGHVAALKNLNPGMKTYNLGSGQGTSVLEAVRTFEYASSRHIPYEIGPRRRGDVGTVVANPELAKAELNWWTTRSFADACRDTWNWQRQNPSGFAAIS